MRTVALGGKGRVGSGAKITTQLKEFERSTFDVGNSIQTTVSAGTIVPVWNDIALPGTTHDIKIYMDMMTGPTIGPAFVSFKCQADAYSIPIRLYQAQLHNNKNGIGNKMETVKLPQIRVHAPNPKPEDYTNELLDLDNYQINPSHVLSYTNDFRGVGVKEGNTVIVTRDINAIPYLGYYDICKTFYCNKQEGVGYIIHSEPITADAEIILANYFGNTVTPPTTVEPEQNAPIETGEMDTPPTLADSSFVAYITDASTMNIDISGTLGAFDPNRIGLWMCKYSPTLDEDEAIWESVRFRDLFESITQKDKFNTGTVWTTNGSKPLKKFTDYKYWTIGKVWFDTGEEDEVTPRLKEFPLSDIDDMRIDILSKIKETAPYTIEFNDVDSDIPDTSVYKLPLSYTKKSDGSINSTSTRQDQDGLCVGTYQSDIFNNWLDAEEIGLADTVSAIKVETITPETGAPYQGIYVNEISLKTKVWEMMNAITTSGGGLLDYYDAVYDHEVWMGVYSPVYCGGISKELVFQQIISNAQSGDEPLGTLAGRGVLKDGANGGTLTIKTDEPSFIMIVFKLTPRLSYSQGNAWWNNLKTMRDLHNPYMDRIGFQNLITDKMAWWDTQITGSFEAPIPVFKSAGKQTAWLDYQTSYNRVKGNFAKRFSQQYMVNPRNYTPDLSGTTPKIKDLTTYIDPTNTNYIFADVSLSAQNFWLEVDIDAKARRKMSSKTQPIQ